MLNGQPLNLKTFCRFQEAGQTVLRDVHLPFVHELQQGGHVAGGGAVQNDEDARTYWSRLEQVLEVFTARGQDKLVRLERDTFAEERHVRKALRLEQVAKGRRQIAAETVPFQTELLL